MELEKKAFHSLLKLLSYRQYHSLELKKKLKEKGFTASVVEGALEKAEGYGYLQDEEVVNSYVRSLKRKKKSKRFAFYHLKTKGLPEQEIMQALQLFYKDEEQIQALVQLFEKWKDLPQEKKWQRALQRGFNTEHIRQALENSPEKTQGKMHLF